MQAIPWQQKLAEKFYWLAVFGFVVGLMKPDDVLIGCCLTASFAQWKALSKEGFPTPVVARWPVVFTGLAVIWMYLAVEMLVMYLLPPPHPFVWWARGIAAICVPALGYFVVRGCGFVNPLRHLRF